MVRPEVVGRDDLAWLLSRAENLANVLQNQPESWQTILNALDELYPPMLSVACAEHDGVRTDWYREFGEAFERHRRFVEEAVEPAVLYGAVAPQVRHELGATITELVRCGVRLGDDPSFGVIVPLG